VPRKPEKIVEPIDAPFEDVVKAIVTKVGNKTSVELPIARKGQTKRAMVNSGKPGKRAAHQRTMKKNEQSIE